MEPGIGVLHLTAELLRCGVGSIKDPGGGLMSLARFRANSFRVARVFQIKELELFGAAVVNPKLAALLQRQSFVRRVISCPDDLGGGKMEILTKTFEVPYNKLLSTERCTGKGPIRSRVRGSLRLASRRSKTIGRSLRITENS